MYKTRQDEMHISFLTLQTFVVTRHLAGSA